MAVSGRNADLRDHGPADGPGREPNGRALFVRVRGDAERNGHHVSAHERVPFAALAESSAARPTPERRTPDSTSRWRGSAGGCLRGSMQCREYEIPLWARLGRADRWPGGA